MQYISLEEQYPADVLCVCVLLALSVRERPLRRIDETYFYIYFVEPNGRAYIQQVQSCLPRVLAWLTLTHGQDATQLLEQWSEHTKWPSKNWRGTQLSVYYNLRTMYEMRMKKIAKTAK